MKKEVVKKKGIYCFLLAICLMQLRASGQDPVFSQAFLSPIYLNPAATGTGEHDLRISGIYRRQWWTIPSQMNYMTFSADKYLPAINSGVGLMATRSNEGYLKKSGFYASYAYQICAGTASVADNGGTPRWFWTGGLQFGVAQTRLDYSKLVFADDLDINGVIPNYNSMADPAIKSGRYFPDFAAGTFFNYSMENSRLLVGFSGHHINKPDESLTSSSDTIRSQLPVRYTANAVFTYTNPDKPWSFSLALIGYKQAKNSSFQVGGEVTQNDYDISLGMWYRGSVNFRNMNTLNVSLSFNLSGLNNEKEKLRIGVGHDAQVGSNGYSYTAGSSEMGFVWDHSTNEMASDNPCKVVINTAKCPGVNN